MPTAWGGVCSAGILYVVSWDGLAPGFVDGGPCGRFSIENC